MAGEEVERAQAELERRRREQAARAAQKIGGASDVGDSLGPTLARASTRYAAILRDLTSKDPAARERARFAIAEDTRRNLHRYKRTALPTCPVRLPGESGMLGILKKPGKKRTNEERGYVRLFVNWRDAVFRAEHANEATMRALFEAVTTFRALELPDFAGQVLEHLEIEYDVEHVPRDRREWGLEARSKDYETLSPALRRGERERRPASTKHPEDDDTALRGVDIPPPGSKPDDFDADDDFDLPDFP